MTSVEEIRMQLEWGKENLNSPQDNLSLEDVEWLLEQAEKVERLEKENNELDRDYNRMITDLEQQLKGFKEFAKLGVDLDKRIDARIDEQQKKIEQYRKEIVVLRGNAHLSCPRCYDDCQSWIVDGKPCDNDW